MFNTGLIDSLKLRIKLSQVQIIDKRLITDFIEYYPQLDLLDEEVKKAKPLVIIINGITYRYYVKAFINNRKTAEEYLVLQISAKMVKSRYFEGITKDNFKNIVDDINAQNIVKLDYKTFLDGLVSDVDICINQLIDEKSLKSAFSLINQFPQPSKKPLIHNINATNNKGQRNLGIDFNKREKATNTTPYCKIYHKGHELLSKSIAFYKAFLEPMRSSVIDNLVRYEFTVKAKKHKDYLTEKGLKADFKTLNDLLNIKPQELKKIAQTGLKHYIEPKPKSKRDVSELSPTDIMVQYYIENLINLGFDMEKLLGFTYDIQCPVARSRTKTKAKQIIEDFTSVNNNYKIKLLANEKSNKFLQNIGLNF